MYLSSFGGEFKDAESQNSNDKDMEIDIAIESPSNLQLWRLVVTCSSAKQWNRIGGEFK